MRLPIYAWRRHFGSLKPTEVKGLRQVEQESQRLKKMVTDRDLKLDVLKEIRRNKWWRYACAGNRSPTPKGAPVCMHVLKLNERAVNNQ
jgi:hypothetical protein